MDFLVSAFYDEQTCKFLGASTVQFDPTDYCGRGTFRAYMDAEFFSLYKDLHPQGFLLNDDGLCIWHFQQGKHHRSGQNGQQRDFVLSARRAGIYADETGGYAQGRPAG